MHDCALAVGQPLIRPSARDLVLAVIGVVGHARSVGRRADTSTGIGGQVESLARAEGEGLVSGLRSLEQVDPQTASRIVLARLLQAVVDDRHQLAEQFLGELPMDASADTGRRVAGTAPGGGPQYVASATPREEFALA